MIARKTYTLNWKNHTLELGCRTIIMGILNVTPDSFSDGGRFFARDAAVAQGVKMAAEGADIIDIGGESTRPFANAVSAEEEMRRVIPVIERLFARVATPISIDTTKAPVARRALEAGASIINDITALRCDPDMAAVAAEFGTPVVLMHMRGSPQTMQVAPVYADLIGEIRGFLQEAIRRAEQEGLSKARIIIDPGIGFGKTVAHNLLLLKHLDALHSLDVPILVGPSRKSFIRKILKDERAEDIHPDHPAVETGTQATVAAAVLNGAHIVRVHDVANTLPTIKIMDAMLKAE
ncbi:MAG: dihydropteroate synthase [Desulfobacterales bacterium]|nr:MAG: dihydropteroate synthase [Desulfobacterales bacterium]